MGDTNTVAVRNSLIIAGTWGFLLLVFLVDAYTPQDLVIAILFTIPIVLAALTRIRQHIFAMVIAALAGDLTAAILNAQRDHNHWDIVGVWNRVLSAFSIVLVGYLSTAVQERAHHVGLVMAREARMRREISLAAAIDRLRTLLSRELVERALVREAACLFEVDGVSWLSTQRDYPMLSVNSNDRTTIDEHAVEGTELTSLMQSVLDGMLPRQLSRADAFGRLILARYKRSSAIAFPVREGGAAYGTLILWSNSEHVIDDDDILTARMFLRSVATALGRAELFAELANRNETIAERNAIIRDVVYALTHDLRTPLSALGVTMRQARNNAYGNLPPRYAEILDASIAAIDDLQRLAETLLTVARIESGELRTTRDPLDLQTLLSEVSTEFSAMAEQRQISLTLKPHEAVTILGDRGDLRRAITNLLANALEHTPTQGHVELSLELQGNVVRVHVRDDGYGIDPEQRSSLFERFSSARSATGRGTGLGLYIVRRITEAAAGTVQYTPLQPRGSLFTLAFPIIGRS